MLKGIIKISLGKLDMLDLEMAKLNDNYPIEEVIFVEIL